MSSAIEQGAEALGNAHAACVRALEGEYKRHPDGERLLGKGVLPLEGERPVDTCARLVALLARREEAQQSLLRSGHWSYSSLYHQCVRAALRGELAELNTHLRNLIGD